MKQALRAGVAGFVLLAFANAPAYALFGLGDIVYDPTNYAQNILTAERELTQINNQVQSLANEATSLLNEARNLTSLPYSALTSLNQSISQTQLLLTQVQGIAYSVSTIDQAFTKLYPATYGADASSQQLVSDARLRWQNALSGFQDTMRVQAGAVQNLDSTRAEIEALIGASQSATGALQAAQSGNQLTALQTRQLADLTAVMTSMARAQSLESARLIETEEQARAQRMSFLDYGGGYQSSNVQMFH
jgi:P-type conjugative transfer protein TrbJ